MDPWKITLCQKIHALGEKVKARFENFPAKSARSGHDKIRAKTFMDEFLRDMNGIWAELKRPLPKALDLDGWGFRFTEKGDELTFAAKNGQARSGVKIGFNGPAFGGFLGHIDALTQIVNTPQTLPLEVRLRNLLPRQKTFCYLVNGKTVIEGTSAENALLTHLSQGALRFDDPITGKTGYWSAPTRKTSPEAQIKNEHDNRKTQTLRHGGREKEDLVDGACSLLPSLWNALLNTDFVTGSTGSVHQNGTHPTLNHMTLIGPCVPTSVTPGTPSHWLIKTIETAQPALSPTSRFGVSSFAEQELFRRKTILAMEQILLTLLEHALKTNPRHGDTSGWLLLNDDPKKPTYTVVNAWDGRSAVLLTAIASLLDNKPISPYNVLVHPMTRAFGGNLMDDPVHF